MTARYILYERREDLAVTKPPTTRQSGRPKGSKSPTAKPHRVTVRLSPEDYYYLAGLADGRDRDSMARAIRKTVRFFCEHQGGRRQPENRLPAGEDSVEGVNLSPQKRVLPEVAVQALVLPSPVPEVAVFDTARFVLGALCKYGHAYPGTEQSLRYRRGDKDCVHCKRARQSKHLKK